MCYVVEWPGLDGKVRPGTVWRVRVWYDAVMHGRRVMVRLGAVLCGSDMYGLVWQARKGWPGPGW